MSVKALAEAVRAGKRRELAKAITLVEGRLAAQKQQASALLQALMPFSGGSLRIGVSGIPGVGKSTFIEAFGQLLLARGHRICVLAVDPSSPLTGGSIMGDRTRMETLSANENVFIRPSPTGGSLGGVARRTRETILLAEAAGYDMVIVETVGVGQSEALVASMVDVFLVLQMPGSGDELQGIKKGVLELADIVCVTKADGALAPVAKQAKTQLGQALHLTRGREEWQPPVLTASALEGTGMDEVLEAILAFESHQRQTDAFAKRRQGQALRWFRDEVNALLWERLEGEPRFAELVGRLEADVKSGALPASLAAGKVVEEFLS